MTNSIVKTIFLALTFVSSMIHCQEKLSDKYNLMPWPQEIQSNANRVKIAKDFTISINKKEGRVYNYATNIIRRITNRTGVFVDQGFPLLNDKNATVRVSFDEVAELKLGVDESYELDVNNNFVEISAKTDIGALRALETLVQLIDHNENSFFVNGVVIKDNPRYGWRGLMIDVSRHFHPVEVLKRNLDAMASMKMNVFHWHLSDDQGFRFKSDTYPKLHELGSDGLYYTKPQIRDIVSYANKRGIRVVPEIDVPGHATAILAAYPELGSKDGYDYKIERFSGVFHPTLNPINPKVYTFLDNLFAEIVPLFPDVYFHIGGDENEGKHWDENHEIQKFKNKKGFKNNHDLQTYFNIKLQKILAKYDRKLMGWDEIMTDGMPKSAIIHSWRGVNEGFKDGTLIEAVKKGYQAVLSNDYYIDRVQSVDHHYLFDPAGDVPLTKEEESRVLGGEVTMWSELVTPLTVDSRIWPRTAAIAERFWSSKEVKDLKSMRKRLAVVSFQLEELGITHLSYRNQLLRNIAKSKNTESLELLTAIFEPLKIYTRNEGGTEYKTFSPFTLFADACVVDAEDAYNFNLLVDSYSDNPTTEKSEELKGYFSKWKEGHAKFKKLKNNPILNELGNHYENLSKVSSIYLEILKGGSLSKSKGNEIKETIEKLKKPMVDTELVIVSGMEKLLKKLKKEGSIK
ncbi:beta-N-acetylhexosaminidase [Tenacibaculum xiamenense]|uniref:beta-N-acetylhexosaminidase n=1 Tax=Tenacibaculum xiamenense TaxID=1261553 RepID=UPI00389556F5